MSCWYRGIRASRKEGSTKRFEAVSTDDSIDLAGTAVQMNDGAFEVNTVNQYTKANGNAELTCFINQNRQQV